jgi:hypothetical protein
MAQQGGITTRQNNFPGGAQGAGMWLKRNDEMLGTLPIGVIILPGTGIQDNLVDKAKAMGIQSMDYRNKGGG